MKKIPSVKCDLLVVGAGVAGVAAAVAASRMGLKTILIEKTVFAGGLATSGMILHYLPLSDSLGRQVTFGIAEELLMESIKYGPGAIPPDWRMPKSGSRLGSRFSPASFVLALDEYLLRENVEVWFDTLLCAAKVSNGRLRSVEVENKSGRIKISADLFVDASGDADLAKFAGADFAEQTNYLSIWSLAVSLTAAKSACESGDGTKLLQLLHAGAGNAGGNLPQNAKKYLGTIGKEVSEFLFETRRILREKVIAEQSVHGKNNFYPIALPSMADFRTTRRVSGKYLLKTGEKWTHFDDCIGLVADWRGGWDIWEIPFRTLIPCEIRGLLCAGRCISSEGEAWEVTRVIQAAAMTGEVCGVAAAMSKKASICPDELPPGKLRAELSSRGYLLDLRELGEIPESAKKTEPKEEASHENFYDNA